jgi:hypothetical protein
MHGVITFQPYLSVKSLVSHLMPLRRSFLLPPTIFRCNVVASGVPSAPTINTEDVVYLKLVSF